MRAVVLVGGFGTRLRPLTASLPKPMLPVGHRPLIARLIDRLARGGVTEVVLALGFKPEPFVEAFPDGTCGGVTLRYAVEPEPLDTGGAVRFAADEAGIDDTFVVANGDILTDLDMAAMVAAHRGHGAEATLHLQGVDDPSAFGVAALDADDRLLEFVEKPAPGTEPSNLINAGTYVLEPSVLDLIEPGTPVSIERNTFPRLVERGRAYGFATDDYWIDAGRPELYRRANLDLLDAGRPDHCDAVAGDAHVAEDAVLVNSIVGDRAAIGAGATVTDTVVLPDAIVEPAAIVTSSLVMGRVGAGATVVDSVIGADGHVSAGTELRGDSLPSPA
ncbi:MAG: sugar phosphate nucleotidyltransferase [Ilumatobacteraceae bacterium]